MADAYRIAEEALGRLIDLSGYFAAPVVVESAEAEGVDMIFLRVRTFSGTLDELPVPAAIVEASLRLGDEGGTWVADPDDFFLLIESARIRLAHAHDPYFAVSLSGIEALPHQLEAVYERMLPQTGLRFLLAHDPGAGKTIMAGLLHKELKLRGVLDRVLILCPAPLTIQWQDEMRTRFEETFEIVGSDLAKNTMAGNAWERFPQVIASIDFAKRPEVRDGILRAPWDLVVVDEAHKCSARTYGTEIRRTKRYELAEELSRQTDRLLLLTATPHQGDIDQFQHFLRLLDEDQFVGLSLDRELIALEESPWFSRRIKEELVDFDGRRLFTDRHAITMSFRLSLGEKDLYEQVNGYINEYLPRQTGRRRASVALARSVFQRRLASSLGAIEATLTSRRNRFVAIFDELERLSPEQQQRRMRDLRLLEVDEEVDLDDTDAEEVEDVVEQAMVAERLEDMKSEITRLGELIETTKQIDRARESKLEALRRCLEQAEFAELRDGRGKLLIFTEYRATQNYLVDHLERWGFRTVTIHGGMDAQARKQAQYRFQTDAQICVATEAAGEGINLQFCHLMINYDIPWNPNRLEQRMGRIHRIGQKFDVTVFNFLAENTVEGAILHRLLLKLDEIRRSLGTDRVFDVIGTLLDLNQVNLEDMLREAAYNPTKLSDYQAQIDAISYERLKQYEEETGVALATRHVDLSRIRPRDWRSEERRLMPEFVERFFLRAAERISLRVEPRADSLWKVEHVPQRLRSPGLQSVRQYDYPATSYRKLTFRKEHLTEDRHLDAELLSPGHPLFAATVELLEERLRSVRGRAARFIDPSASTSYRIYFFTTQILGELPGGPGSAAARAIPVHAELVAVMEDDHGHFEIAAPDVLHDLTPAVDHGGEEPVTLRPDDQRRAERWLAVSHTSQKLDDLRRRRLDEVAIRREYVERSYHELIRRRRNDWAALASRVASGDEQYKLPRDEAQRRLDEAERRREHRLADLRHLEVLRPGPAAYLGSVMVDQVDDPDTARLTKVDPEVEQAAVDHVMAYERNRGWEPEYVGELRDGSGFDIRSVAIPDDGVPSEVRRIEVKGRSGVDPTVVLTPNEWTQAGRHGDTYWLYIVTNATSSRPGLWAIQDPARLFGRVAEELTVVKGYLLPGSSVKEISEEES